MISKINPDKTTLHSSVTYHVSDYAYWQIKKILRKESAKRIEDAPVVK
jgi:hypothetical protein